VSTISISWTLPPVTVLSSLVGLLRERAKKFGSTMDLEDVTALTLAAMDSFSQINQVLRYLVLEDLATVPP